MLQQIKRCSMGDKLGYAILEIGGIQKYILATGKLKEMIGGSQLVEEMSKNSLKIHVRN